ncbi:MAG: ABC transporter ATP-binding protein [Roseibacillus sp.]
MSYLSVDHVTKIYPSLEPGAKKGDEFVVFKDVNFQIEKGEFVSMIGHSGCGKSTLLNIMAGFDDATKGGIILDGKQTTKPGLDRMVVFQNFALMPWATAFQNVAMAVKQSHKQWNKSEVKEWTMKYLQMMNLESAANRRPSMLSGGMRQRVGLARAFAAEPKILLLDEPFAQIDALTRGSIQEELLRMWEATNSTVFMVTHDVDEAILLSNRIAMMSNGPEAELAEIVDISIPRPRIRAELIEDPEYSQIRAHILKFLVSGKKAPMDAQKPKKVLTETT